MRKAPMTSLMLGLGLALLFGCGGGGGSSSSGSSVTYTGLTTEAAITKTDDASTLTKEALNSAASGTFNPGTLTPGAKVVEADRASRPDLVQALAKLGDLVRPAAVPAAAGPFSETLTSPCGKGTGFIAGTDNSVPGHVDIYGSLTFSGFCIPSADGREILLSGSVGFTIAGTSSSDFRFAISTTRLGITLGGNEYVYALDYSCQITGGTAGQVRLNATYLAPDGKTYKIENYLITVDATGHTISISGRLYHPDYGYVEVTTPEPIVYADCGGVYRPFSGRLRVTGAGGHYGEFIGGGCTSYTISLDGVLEVRTW